jgi:acyl-CoA thioester hydrolase
MPVRVFYEDTDAGGVVYYANYLRYLERARTEWLRQLGTPREQLRATVGWVFVVTGVRLQYHRPARLDDLLSVHAELLGHGGASLRFAQRVERDGQLLVAGEVDVACVDQTDFKPRRLPPELLASLAASPVS